MTRSSRLIRRSAWGAGALTMLVVLLFGAGSAYASTAFSEDWENGLNGWTVADTSAGPTAADPTWQVLNNPQNVSVAPGINPQLVTLPDAGSLPAAHGGTHAAWFGDTTSGTFCGADWATSNVNQSKDGCFSREPFSGTLTSPTFSLVDQTTATLHFFSWWEIEGVAGDAFDLMQIEYSTDGGASWSDPVKLNPLGNTAGQSDQSYSNNGLEVSPSWHEYLVDLSPAAGSSTVQIRFVFDTGDEEFNGFRGWLIDDLSVSSPADVGAPQITDVTTCEAGQSVAIVDGSNFVEGSQAIVDDATVPANVISSQRIELSPLAAGAHTIQIKSPDGTTSNTFDTTVAACQPVPTVGGLTPTAGPPAGGNAVTISGANFTGATAVSFGDNAATDFSVDSDNQITATAPPGADGTVNVTVTTPAGTSLINGAAQYTYEVPPVITRIAPASGPTAGGNAVTITGTGLLSATAVSFGDTAATDFAVDSDTQITAIAPPGSVGTVDVTVANAVGTSATGANTRYSYQALPAITGISPTSGPTSGGTTVTITGTGLSAASSVSFGASAATGLRVDSDTQITATAPAGSAGTVDVTVTTPGGASSPGAADRYTYVGPKPPPPPPPSTTKPAVISNDGSPSSSSQAGLAGDVNPGGLPTTAHFEYGLDRRYTTPGASGPNYDHSTPDQPLGSGFTAQTVSASVSGLVPNALYHVRLVATNSAGTTFGPDQTFTTPKASAPSQPALGKSFNVSATGLVLIQINGKLVPLTQLTKIPNGTIINALHGTLTLTSAATGGTQHATIAAKNKKPSKPKTQTGKFGGAVFKITQSHSGLATLSLVEGSVNGAPSYASCKAKPGKAVIARLSKRTLQLLHGSAHGKFRTKGRYAAATIRGTIWTIADRCDGTLVHAIKDTVTVNDSVRHKTIALHPGHSYLAQAQPPKVKKKKTHK